MKKIKFITPSLLSAILLLLILVGCTSRNKPPVMDFESTLSYPSKKAGGISVKINFYQKLNERNVVSSGNGVVFTIGKKANLYTEVKISNGLSNKADNHLFHLDWVSPDGKSVFTKQFYLPGSDTTSRLISSISISPDKRKPGNYTLLVYYFRELIAEKKFELRPEPHFKPALYNEITTRISLYSMMSNKPSKRLIKDAKFTIKEKARIQASISIENNSEYNNEDLRFRIDWIGPDDILIYRKKIDPIANDTSVVLNSSISISPDKREAGHYLLRLYLFNELIAEQEFDLRPEPKVTQKMLDEMDTKIVLYRKMSKKTGKRIGEGSVFKTGNKRRVRTIIRLNKPMDYGDREQEFHIDWIGPDGKSFYRKPITISPNDEKITIKSSISISSEKRQPGAYAIRIYLFDQLIGKKKFTLIRESPVN